MDTVANHRYKAADRQWHVIGIPRVVALHAHKLTTTQYTKVEHAFQSVQHLQII